MNLNEFTNDRLPFQYGEILPEDCTKHEIPMGAVPNEKDNTNFVYYIDGIFAGGGEQPVPPVPPVPPTPEVTIFHYEDGTTSESEDTELAQTSYDTSKVIVSVEIGSCATSIGDEAFYGCSGLTSVTIPYSVTSIGNQAFENCTGLTSIEIPNSVTSIGDAAFYYCTGLTSVVIGSSVTSIGGSAFWLGQKFSLDITFISETPVSLVNGDDEIIHIFGNGDYYENMIAIHVPDGLENTYATHDAGWEAIAKYIVRP